MKKYLSTLLYLIILLFFISCEEDLENIDLCRDVDCVLGRCEVKENTVVCVCNNGYHEENLKCIKDRLKKDSINSACEKIVPCKIGGEENIKLCTERYNSFYNSNLDGIYAYYMPINKEIEKYIKCINSKSSCDEYNICYNQLMKIEHTQESCSDNKSSCKNDRLKTCENDKIVYQDCIVTNKRCLTINDTKALCSNSIKCDKNNFKNYCNDKGSLIYCGNGITKEKYCPYYNQTCETQNNITNCYFKEEPLSCEGYKTQCKDDKMITCRNNQELITPCNLFGEDFVCKNFSYIIGDFQKNTHGCFKK